VRVSCQLSRVIWGVSIFCALGVAGALETSSIGERRRPGCAERLPGQVAALSRGPSCRPPLGGPPWRTSLRSLWPRECHSLTLRAWLAPQRRAPLERDAGLAVTPQRGHRGRWLRCREAPPVVLPRGVPSGALLSACSGPEGTAFGGLRAWLASQRPAPLGGDTGLALSGAPPLIAEGPVRGHALTCRGLESPDCEASFVVLPRGVSSGVIFLACGPLRTSAALALSQTNVTLPSHCLHCRGLFVPPRGRPRHHRRHWC